MNTCPALGTAPPGWLGRSHPPRVTSENQTRAVIEARTANLRQRRASLPVRRRRQILLDERREQCEEMLPRRPTRDRVVAVRIYHQRKRPIRRHQRVHHRLGVLEMHVVVRSEEHTSELQSRFDLVCRLLLEKKK